MHHVPRALICYLLIAVIAFLTYAHILGYFFNDRDSFALIETARIRDGADVARVVMTRPVYNIVVSYHRPLAILSYSLDYLFWELNPFGYHLTDLILHVLVSLSVFSVACSITRGDRLVALISAILFTLHPILVESVPSPERRHDVLAALFFLLSFQFYIKEKRLGYRTLSLLFYVMSLCSKEVAVILPFVVWAYLALFENGPGRIARGLRRSTPLYLVTAVYILWRLAGPGARAYQRGASNVAVIAKIWMTTISRYFTDLVYPVDFISLLPRSVVVGLYTVLACVILALFIFSWRRSTSLLGRRGPAFRVVGLSLSVLSLLSVAALLTFPFTRPLISRVIGLAYVGESFSFIGKDMAARGVVPMRYYVDFVNSLLMGVFFFTFFASWLGLLLIANMDRVGKALEISQKARLVAFLTLWLLVPFIFYLATVRFAHRYMYLPAIPFSMLLSMGLVMSLRSLTKGIALLRNAACFLVCAALSVSLVAYSPLLRSYGGWEGSAKVASMFLSRLLALLPDIPRSADLYIHGLPWGISSYEEMIPHVKSVGYLTDYSVRSWLELNDPGNERRVIIRDSVVLQTPPSAMRLEVETGYRTGDVVITVVSDPEQETREACR